VPLYTIFVNTSTVHRQFLKFKWRLREILVAQYAILFSKKVTKTNNIARIPFAAVTSAIFHKRPCLCKMTLFVCT